MGWILLEDGNAINAAHLFQLWVNGREGRWGVVALQDDGSGIPVCDAETKEDCRTIIRGLLHVLGHSYIVDVSVIRDIITQDRREDDKP